MWTIKHHKEFEKQICAKCPADINRDYAPCAKCRRAQDFEAGFNDGYEKGEEKLAKAKDHIKQLLDCLKQDTNDPQTNYYVCQYMNKAEQFLKEIGK